MKTIKSIKSMQKLALSFKGKKKISFVPTMGFLHEGHLSLVRKAKQLGEIVVVSIYVNPTQFSPNEDLDSYPRDLKGDLAKLKKLGVDFVFLPRSQDMYGTGFQTTVTVKNISQGLCGAKRPGHFEGVATIVMKLFQIVQPDVAIFGRKDFQQLAVIKTMVKDLNLPVKIIGGKIVREKSGLAMSSRNSYLSPHEKELAASIYKGLLHIKQEVLKSKNTTAQKMKMIFKSNLPKSRGISIDYIECVHVDTLLPLEKYVKNKTVVAVAVKVGRARLIDNMMY